MRNRISAGFLLVFVVLFSINCKDNPSGTDISPDMEIHYTKTGGWINTSRLDIYGNGLVNAYQVKHASSDTLDSASTILSEEEQNRVVSLFGSFSTYDSHYEPDVFFTDQNYYTIVFIYEGEIDTVSVYMPGESNIPSGLEEIIDEMEIFCNSMFE